MGNIENPESFNAKAEIGHPRQTNQAQAPRRDQSVDQGEQFTYKRRNAVGAYDTRQATAAEHDALKAEGWLRLDEITGNEEDATAKPPSAAPAAPLPK